MSKVRVSAAPLWGLALSGLAVAFAGCGKQMESVLKEVAAKHTPAEDPFSTDVVARGARDLEAQLGAPLQLLDLEITRHRIAFEAQDPAKPQNVDSYELKNGVLLAAKPVQLIGGDDVAGSVYPLASVRLEKIPEFTREAIAALGFEDAQVSSLRIRRKFSAIPSNVLKTMAESRKRMGLPPLDKPGELADGEIEIGVYVDSPRRKGFVQANADFKILRTSTL
jgi:hypothetical protein